MAAVTSMILRYTTESRAEKSKGLFLYRCALTSQCSLRISGAERISSGRRAGRSYVPRKRDGVPHVQILSALLKSRIPLPPSTGILLGSLNELF